MTDNKCDEAPYQLVRFLSAATAFHLYGRDAVQKQTNQANFKQIQDLFICNG
jgi:hypothetical protein